MSSLPEVAELLRAAVREATEATDAANAATGSAGRAVVVLIDGPSGAGKSTLADLLVAEWPTTAAPQLVRMDDLYPGWSGLDVASVSIGRDLLTPLLAGLPAGWRRWNWADDAPAEWHAVDPARPVVVEGCGTLARANAPQADLCIWLDADDVLRKERALARDGLAFEGHWDQWQSDFERYVDREHPRRNADLILDVTACSIETGSTRLAGR
ncbi:ATP-binding protein [Leifsonia sp. NPDC058230]|uniref:ATP-binding protein n=1 Tax=Leifsonia sp. NPDC058230 TaxID=3346391 RepID=UPI0036DF7A57